ncbi:MAG TPA: hypothetical protein VK139_07555 [Microbacteriaceae bacterium]|nr:hypothetical protein [Microbacteriaceae bacterium]
MVGSGLMLASAMVLGASPAFASPFDDGYVVLNGMNIEIENDEAGISHARQYLDPDNSSLGDTTAHFYGNLDFTDANSSTSSAECNDNTAVATEEADGDIVVTCDSRPLNNDLSGLSVAPEYRFYNLELPGVVLSRMLYVVENTTGSDITVSRMQSTFEWDAYSSDWQMRTSEGIVTQDSSLDDLDARWLSTVAFLDGSVDPSYSTFAAAWRASDKAVFSEFGNDVVSDDYVEVIARDVVIPAGATVYFAFFGIHGSPGIEASTDEVNAFMTALDEFVTVFDEPFNADSLLAKGIPVGSSVLNWGDVTEAAAPAAPVALASTGPVGLAGGVTGAMVLVLAGAAIVLVRRRLA